MRRLATIALLLLAACGGDAPPDRWDALGPMKCPADVECATDCCLELQKIGSPEPPVYECVDCPS